MVPTAVSSIPLITLLHCFTSLPTSTCCSMEASGAVFSSVEGSTLQAISSQSLCWPLLSESNPQTSTTHSEEKKKIDTFTLLIVAHQSKQAASCMGQLFHG